MMVIGRILCTSLAVVATLTGALLFKSVIVSGSTDCDDNLFPCEDGECIYSEQWCNSQEDCFDGSDEKYCEIFNGYNPDPNECSSIYFRCRNGPCIPLSGRCDGFVHCEDSSDEKNCVQKDSNSRSSQFYTTAQTIVSSTMIAIEGFNEIQFFNSLNSSQNSVQIEHFLGLNPHSLAGQRNLALGWLLSKRRDDYGWGDETPRAIMAVILSNQEPMTRDIESNKLMIKQLEIQLLLELARNVTNPMKLADLALYNNALLVSCKDPKSFYGDNLVRALRDGVNAAQKLHTLVNPSIYLSLCIQNATIFDDIEKIQYILLSRNDTSEMIDIQAFALLAATCIFQKTDFLNASIYDDLKKEFLRNVKNNCFPGNVYEAALLAQALQEMKVTLVGLIDFILKQQQESGSFGDVLSTYLVLPILAGKSMLQIDDQCGHRNAPDITLTEVLKNVKSKKIHVQYSLNYGLPPEIKQTIQIQVAEGTNFLEIMRLAQEINPKYRFKRDDNCEMPFVYSIGEIPNDAERGMYWKLYTAPRNSNETTNEKHWIFYIGDVKQLIPSDGEKFLFWYRPL